MTGKSVSVVAPIGPPRRAGLLGMLGFRSGAVSKSKGTQNDMVARQDEPKAMRESLANIAQNHDSTSSTEADSTHKEIEVVMPPSPPSGQSYKTLSSLKHCSSDSSVGNSTTKQRTVRSIVSGRSKERRPVHRTGSCVTPSVAKSIDFGAHKQAVRQQARAAKNPSLRNIFSPTDQVALPESAPPKPKRGVVRSTSMAIGRVSVSTTSTARTEISLHARTTDRSKAAPARRGVMRSVSLSLLGRDNNKTTTEFDDKWWETPMHPEIKTFDKQWWDTPEEEKIFEQVRGGTEPVPCPRPVTPRRALLRRSDSLSKESFGARKPKEDFQSELLVTPERIQAELPVVEEEKDDDSVDGAFRPLAFIFIVNEATDDEVDARLEI